MTDSNAVHPLSFLVVLAVSAVLGLFVAGALGAVVLTVLGLAVYAATVDDVDAGDE
ncbi:hypothetical protein [Halobacterium sp. CBA1126]|uniref:hypothetical protein n=1 Tax=Halobacterium TaxID=2239 RepID=UPI0012F895EA|nr:hypothetical protein [Halobacterium sp. CBA1126]MUV60597.1 hypothetical protein [Halobacterium sp. CBA1126]